jgi:hypothetical protein
MIGRRILNLPDNLGYLLDPGDEEFTLDSTQLRKRAKYLSNTLNHFWKRWRSEYLVELRESHRQSKKNSPMQPPITAGDIVVVHDENLPRGFRKLGRVEEVIAGRDGRVRGATVKLAAINRQQTLIHRPIQLLYPLEIHDEQSTGPSNGLISHEPESQPSSQHSPTESPVEQDERGARRRSKRIAANQSDDRRRAIILQLEDN